MEACNSGSLGEWRLDEVEAVALGCAVLFFFGFVFVLFFVFCFSRKWGREGRKLEGRVEAGGMGSEAILEGEAAGNGGRKCRRRR